MSSDVTILYRPFARGTDSSRALLADAARRYAGLAPGAIAEAPEGKPFFPALPELGCSVTHSGDFWMCALGRQALGLDLQRHKTHSPPEKLSRRFLHPTEDQWLAAGNYQRFFDVWTAKESFLKFTGQGLPGGLNRFSVVSPHGEFPKTDGAELRMLPFAQGYSLCLCAQRIGAVSINSF